MEDVHHCRSQFHRSSTIFQIENGFLTEFHRELVKEKVLEIVRQLEDDPNCLPRVYLPHDPSMPTGAPLVEEKASTVSVVSQEPVQSTDTETFKVKTIELISVMQSTLNVPFQAGNLRFTVQPVALNDGSSATITTNSLPPDESASSSPAVLNETSPQGTTDAANMGNVPGSRPREDGGVTGSTSLEVLKMKLENVMPSSTGAAVTEGSVAASIAASGQISDGSQHSEQSTIHQSQGGKALVEGEIKSAEDMGDKKKDDK